jgi:hypothetical protein
MDRQKEVDESWKESAKETIIGGKKEGCEDHACGCSHDHDHDHGHAEEDTSPLEINFVNYVSSLGFQSMIFLGEIPHPMTNKTEKNIDQAKFIIDTLAMLKDKTKGNLTQQEQQLLDASVYELRTPPKIGRLF